MMQATVTLLCLCLGAGLAHAECTVGNFAVEIHRARFVDKCDSAGCMSLAGVATLTSRCAEPYAVMVRFTAYDKARTPVATREVWPFQTRNIAGGAHPFSLDSWLEYDPDIVTFSAEVVDVRKF